METLKLTIQEAQELLLLSQSSVYSWIDKGKLQSQETPGGKIIIISRKEAEEIKNFNLKSRRNKVAKQVSQKSEENSNQNPDSSATNTVINAEILENDSVKQASNPDSDFSKNQDIQGLLGQNLSENNSSNMTLKLISKIEELALEAGRFKQLEILRNEEKENVKFWQEKYHELSSELKQKDYEIMALKAQIEALKANSKNSILKFFKRK